MKNKSKFLSKHSSPAILQKVLLLVFAISLMSLTYSCLNSDFKGISEEGSFILSMSCFPFFLGSFHYFFGLMLLIFLFIYFFKDNLFKLPYYLSEFLLIIFGVYGIVIIQKAINSTISWKFTTLNLVLIFIISVILLDFREIFKDLMEES